MYYEIWCGNSHKEVPGGQEPGKGVETEKEGDREGQKEKDRVARNTWEQRKKVRRREGGEGGGRRRRRGWGSE